jgi:endo-1,4-beta-xylanase
MIRFPACLLTFFIASATFVRGAESEPDLTYLWEGAAPGSEGETGEEVVRLSDSGERIITNVHRPSLTVYPAEGAAEPALTVLIIPGGGHREIWTDHEG